MSVAGNGATGSEAADDALKLRQLEPRVMDGSSSSKVTVEYHDPSGLFPLVQEQLTSRFPLRNLHWKSPNRPLRSIDSLHVGLVPSQDSVHIAGVTSPGLAPPDGSSLAPPGHRASQPSAEIIKPPSKERRHQIPGLRTTPYLKVYLLRCDDSDTYKSTSRKLLREWVKTHTPPSQSSTSASTQENHDAFEWMIIHVVIPDTQAATQPRGSSSSTAAVGEKEKTTSTSRWTRGTTTILEKIRADFNVVSKSAPDRVGQVRLQKNDVPPHMLQTTSPITSPSIAESPEEQERYWNDIITKFKTLILLSFDLRVSQYEEDLREKDSQRALPGWNFCTFFILKEGLARGFESVGLVEDALLGYDELSVGLDTVVREQAQEGNEAQGGAMLNYTEDLFQQASKILSGSQKDGEDGQEVQAHTQDARPIDSAKKNYRDLILSNNISVLDFRCYIFARQMSLLLRLGNAHSARSDLGTKRPGHPNRSQSVDDVHSGRSGGETDDGEDLLALAELCSRALDFITFAGRLLQDDLINSAKAHGVELPQYLIDNLVQSWTYSALQQVLEETATASLPISYFLVNSTYSDRGEKQKSRHAEPKSPAHPKRSSSLHYGRPSSNDPSYAQTPPSGQIVYENGQYRDRSGPAQDGSAAQKTGIQELAGTRAHLLAVQRRILEHVGKSLGWAIGWAAILESEPKRELEEVDLDGKSDAEEEEKDASAEAPEKKPTTGLSAAAIVHAISSIDQFREFYEKLSDIIVKHYMAAGQSKAAETVLGDLAALRYEVGDYAAAATYFSRMASSFAESRWNLVEGTMLKLYAQCLKKLNRKDDYTRTLLDLLAKSAADKRKLRTVSDRTAAASSNWLDDDKLETTGVLSELIEYSEQLPKDRIVSMKHYFDDITVEPYLRHYEDKDGFQLRLQFRHLLEDEATFDSAKVRLISAASVQAKEIWLESSGPIDVKRGVCRTWLNSNVNATGPYMVDRILLSAKRIVFSHEPFTKAEATTPLGIITSTSAASLKAAKKSRVLLYPRKETFQARLYHAYSIHVDRQRSIEIECSSGWNDIQSAEIRLRSASAGLRLRTANATVSGGEIELKEKQNPGIVAFGSMPKDTSAMIQIPYEVETMLPELSIKAEIEYVTGNGNFQFHSSFTVPIELPLDVNVHDHFKDEALFSKFNIKTASHMPLEIIDIDLDGSDEYGVQAPSKGNEPIMVFPRQPVSITYKISKKEGVEPEAKPNKSAKEGSLALSIAYRCLDEDILDRLRELFASSIKDSPVDRLAPLLLPAFADGLVHRVLPHQYERIALLDRVDLGTYENMGWNEYIDTLPQSTRAETEAWLRKWHEDHKSILVPSTSTPTSTSASSPSSAHNTAPPSPRPPRRIIITVSIPQTHILHTASLSLPSSLAGNPTAIATAGKPLTATLSIAHTRRWAPRSALPKLANITNPDDAIDFVYSVEANPDTWLIAGPRRAQFSAREGEEVNAEVVLVPLRTGRCVLPGVEIRSKVKPREPKKGEGALGGDDEEQLNCDTDYLNYGECVVVVGGVETSTIGVGEIGRAGNVVWLEAGGS